MELCTQIAVAVIALVAVAFYWSRRKPKNYPKGPFAWPIVGNLPQIAMNAKNGAMHFLFEEYAKIYGKVVAVKMGSIENVVLHDYDLIKEAWNHPHIQGRPLLSPSVYRTGGITRGIIFVDGEEWTEQRRFTMRSLKNLGFGKRSMEASVTEEAQGLIEDLKKNSGKPISTQNLFNVAVVNALWQITAGERFERNDPELKEILEAITRNTSGGGTEILGIFMPWIAKVVPGLIGWHKFTTDLPFTFNYLLKFSKARLQSYDGNNPEHFTDVYIDEMRKTTSPQSSFYGKRGELTLAATLSDLFEAGSETTSTTLTWMCLYMSLYPEKQVKLHEEIDRVLGSTFPTLDDRSRLPYLESSILETLRFSSLVPLGLFHRTTEDVTLGGGKYFIPKNTMVTGNLHSVHFDTEIWGDPNNFRPERFLSPDGTSVVKHEGLIPFSIGKRVCIGEALAMQELFIFSSHVFQQLKVTWDPSGPKPSLDQSVRAVATPLPHKLIFTERI